MREKVILVGVTALAAAAAVCGTEKELKWDTGNPATGVMCLNVGADFWFANDFDVSTLKLRRISSLKIMCCSEFGWNDAGVSTSKPLCPDSPEAADCRLTGGSTDEGWDGFRIAIFEFVGSAPGSIMWPKSGVPKYVKPSGPSRYVWCRFDVGWTLPKGTTAFVAGQEQYFLPPGCDLFSFDDDVESRGHTWHRGPKGDWEPHYGFATGRNLMVRAILSGDVSVRPASFGRVKALYQ